MNLFIDNIYPDDIIILTITRENSISYSHILCSDRCDIGTPWNM